MGISFSSSLFGLAGSLILASSICSRARPRIASTPTSRTGSPHRARHSGEGVSTGGADLQGAIERLRTTVEEGGGGRNTTAAMANLAEAIQGLVAHMRTEQQMIREWADGQGEQNREIKRLLERLARQPEKS